jgi:hypothetical protein
MELGTVSHEAKSGNTLIIEEKVRGWRRQIQKHQTNTKIYKIQN